MALPKSGTAGSNVLQLDDIRNKQSKTRRKSKTAAQSKKADVQHTLTADSENEAQPPGKVDELSLCSEIPPDAQNSDAEVIKTPAKRSLVSNRRFDKVKVERIKAELADGSYEINFLQVADKFIEHERFG